MEKLSSVLWNFPTMHPPLIYYVAEGFQGTLFELLEIERPSYDISAEKVKETYFYIPQVKENHFQLQNRRYIGGKHKLIEWIFSILNKECKGESFTDIFAGTGIVSAIATKHFTDLHPTPV